LPADTQLGFNATLKQPPTIMGGDGADAGSVLLALNGLEVTLNLTSAGAPPSQVVLDVSGVLGAQPSVDDKTGTIGLQLTDLQVSQLSITNGQDAAATFNLDQARLQQLVSGLVLPLLDKQVGRLPLAPSSFAVAGYYITVDGLAVKPEGAYVGLGAFAKPANDSQAPVTRIDTNPGSITRPGLVKFVMGGTDDQTPEKLLRYSWQLDDGPVSDPTFEKEIRVPVTTAGQHLFRVVAVDLNDNVDPAPQQYVFTLDPTPPLLTLVSGPGALVSTNFATINVSGSDDVTPAGQLLYSWKVDEALPGQANQTIAQTDPAPLSGPIVVQNLHEGGVYTVTVTVQDQAGNVASQQVAFSVANSGGCSVSRGAVPAGGDASLMLLALLAGAVLFVRCSRRAGARMPAR
jgi:hypothetical protein